MGVVETTQNSVNFTMEEATVRTGMLSHAWFHFFSVNISREFLWHTVAKPLMRWTDWDDS